MWTKLTALQRSMARQPSSSPTSTHKDKFPPNQLLLCIPLCIYTFNTYLIIFWFIRLWGWWVVMAEISPVVWWAVNFVQGQYLGVSRPQHGNHEDVPYRYPTLRAPYSYSCSICVFRYSIGQSPLATIPPISCITKP